MTDPHGHGHPGDASDQRHRHHDHLWHLPDGTGLHAPIGVVVRHPDTGEVCCHVCGRWYRALGSHVRVHGYTGAEYRQTMGLSRHRPLTAPDVSTAIADRQRNAYRASPELRAQLAIGQELARTGTLGEHLRAASVADRAETRARRERALEQGRVTQQRQRAASLQRTLERVQAASLGDYLRTEYQRGASLDQLARTTGLGRARLRSALDEADVTVRANGTNTATGKRARAVAADAQAAARVGTGDLGIWLRARRDEGASVSELAGIVGHSLAWVRWRLQRATSDPPEAAATSTATTAT